jgi:FlaA1/EpsC-like NDP-sugar epimerase
MSDPNMLSQVLGRNMSLFSDDWNSHLDEIRKFLIDQRVLIIGAAGSIGGAFAKLIASFQLKSLHLIDLSENNLVELVRDFRSSGTDLPDDFKTLAISFDGPEFAAYLRSEATFDYILNFSALKHVRSERDPFSLLRLLRVNVQANQTLLDCLAEQEVKRVFAVSSDKAVAPASMMGASKAFMERVFLANGNKFHFNSARFANVAFSDGSLLHGFNQRILKRQPLSAPTDVRRFFISHEEAAQLCLLAFTLGKRNEIYYPKLNPTEDLKSFSDIAQIYLKHRGFEPIFCEADSEARGWLDKNPNDGNKWPCFFSTSNTSGEKPYEEFVGVGEKTDESRYQTVGVISDPIQVDNQKLNLALDQLSAVSGNPTWNKTELMEIVKSVVPELEHVETQQNLDQKM